MNDTGDKKTINAGIITLQDGTPCIVMDTAPIQIVTHVLFDNTDHTLSLVFDDQSTRRFDYPLDMGFIQILRKHPRIAIATMNNGQPADLNTYPVVSPPVV